MIHRIEFVVVISLALAACQAEFRNSGRKASVQSENQRRSAARSDSLREDDVNVVLLQLKKDLKASFQIRNDSNEVVWYRGYEMESPIFSIRDFKYGLWQERKMGWCGTGLTRCKLKPGEENRFEVFWDVEVRGIQVGVRVFSGRDTEGGVRWSEQVMLP